MIKLRFNFLIILILIFSYSVERLDIFKDEVVELESFTDYYRPDEVEEGEELLGTNFFTIKKEYTFEPELEKISLETKKVEKKVIKLSEYTIVKGDNIAALAKRYNIKEDVLRYNNPKMGNILRIGSKIKVPSENGIFYSVKKGDSLGRIASGFKIKIERIREYNNIVGNNIGVGEKLFIKDPYIKIEVPKPTMVPKTRITAKKTRASRTIAKTAGFRMPIKYSGVTSPYGNRFHPVLKRYILHAGVDLRAKYITLYAAKEGIVKSAMTQSGYGKIIIITHANGYETRYAHLNSYNVKVGQKVASGEIIGQTGNTGRSTGPHLHFEIRKNGKTLDPMRALGK
ncbi:MAG: peptidoglycan DD-metalloendopeptidase family protein [Fusobacteriaceae bacterium]